MAKASVTNATLAFERAQTLLQDLRRHAEDARGCRGDAAHGAGAAEFGARPAWRAARWQVRSPDRSSRSTSGRARWCRRAGRWFRCCRRATSRCGSSCRRRCCRRVALGNDVTVHCDGCKADVPAKVSFISRSAEFTPPVIYSQEERAKLVFLIEARTGTPGELRVGQPVDVRFGRSQRAK